MRGKQLYFHFRHFYFFSVRIFLLAVGSRLPTASGAGGAVWGVFGLSFGSPKTERLGGGAVRGATRSKDDAAPRIRLATSWGKLLESATTAESGNLPRRELSAALHGVD